MIDLRCGDALEVLKGLPDRSVDSICTDPPAAIHMMQMDWDHDKGGRDQWIAWLAGIMAEARRCLRPGGYALVWALPRTSHWTGMALEDAGFQLRDQISHLFSTGFPKSHSCLKPAHETWWLAKAPGPRQPLQIDACRIPAAGNWYDAPGDRGHADKRNRASGYALTAGSMAQGGRWPPNTLLSHHPECQPAGVRRVPADKRGQGRPRGTFPHSDDAWGNGHRAYTGAETAGDGTEAQQEYLCVDGCPIAELDRQTAGTRAQKPARNGLGGWRNQYVGADSPAYWAGPSYRDGGSASRFFPTFPGADPEDAVPFRYQPKAPPAERRLADGTPTGHPTQKPVALAQWLVALVCAPGGTVLDPFAGVGSLGVGALRAGCHYLGIEQDAGYAAVAQRRLDEEQERADGQLALPLSLACG